MINNRGLSFKVPQAPPDALIGIYIDVNITSFIVYIIFKQIKFYNQSNI